MALALRDYEVFRGDPAHLPDVMLKVFAGLVPEPQVLRVAKIEEQIIGCYAVYLPSDAKPCHELAMVMVSDPYRRNGVAESRGGRQLLAPLAGPGDFLLGLGFRGKPNDYRFEMIPE
jgi:hypothetical protein